MTDINSQARRRLSPGVARNADKGGPAVAGTGAGAVLREPVIDDGLLGLVELLFFAYRDFTGEADAVLQEFGFGRAHHRVLHFVNRRPGLRVADLLDILRITKQSLARVLKQLVDRGFIAQAAGPNDRRERRLYLTTSGKALALKLAQLQMAQIEAAVRAAGGTSPGRDSVRRFLLAMIAPEHRDTIAASIERTGGDSVSAGADEVVDPQPVGSPTSRRTAK